MRRRLTTRTAPATPPATGAHRAIRPIRAAPHKASAVRTGRPTTRHLRTTTLQIVRHGQAPALARLNGTPSIAPPLPIPTAAATAAIRCHAPTARPPTTAIAVTPRLDRTPRRAPIRRRTATAAGLAASMEVAEAAAFMVAAQAAPMAEAAEALTAVEGVEARTVEAEAITKKQY